MKVKFKKARDTLKYGKVEAGQVVEVAKEDGNAFIKNGVAEKVREKKDG